MNRRQLRCVCYAMRYSILGMMQSDISELCVSTQLKCVQLETESASKLWRFPHRTRDVSHVHIIEHTYHVNTVRNKGVRILFIDCILYKNNWRSCIFTTTTQHPLVDSCEIDRCSNGTWSEHTNTTSRILLPTFHNSSMTFQLAANVDTPPGVAKRNMCALLTALFNVYVRNSQSGKKTKQHK